MAKREEESWVVDTTNKLKEVETSAEQEFWQKRSIYRVPDFIKEHKPWAYEPQIVSFGPYHHDNTSSMEEHKNRALHHFLKRAARPLDDFFAGMEENIQQLQGSYQNLGDKWRDRDGFLQLMIVDGCFMLEVIRVATGRDSDYAFNDPIFSTHGMSYQVPCIKKDMLRIENQLPLLVLKTLVAIETGGSPNDDQINWMVLKFLAPSAQPPTPGIGLGLHPLDLFRRSLLQGPPVRSTISRAEPTLTEIVRSAEGTSEPTLTEIVRSAEGLPVTEIVRSAEGSAVKLYEAGISFRRSQSNSLRDISFRNGVLTLPQLVHDDTTYVKFHNLIAFEHLHVGATNAITSYIFLMHNIIYSAEDLSLLSSKGIFLNASSDTEEFVVKLFNGLSRGIDIQSSLHEVHSKVNDYRLSKWNRYNTWRANLIHTYFRDPWSFLKLAAAILLLVLTVVQTVYTVYSAYHSH